MKKSLALLLCVVLAAFTLVSCAPAQKQESSKAESSKEESAEESKAEESKAEESSEAEESGAATDEKEKLIFGFWGTAETLETYEYGAQKAEEALPNLDMEFNHYVDNLTFWEALPSDIAAGTAPDFVIATNENIAEYIDKQYFVPFDKSAADVSALLPAAVDAFSKDGEMYGIPTTFQFGLFALNLDMWEEVGLDTEKLPETWDELKEACKVFREHDMYGLCINPIAFNISNIALGHGGGWGEGSTVDTPENAAAFDFIIDMFHEDLCISPAQVGLSSEIDAFVQEKAASTTAGVWYVGSMNSGNPDANYVLMPVPQVDPENPQYPAHGTAIYLINGCSNVELATKAALAFNCEEFQRMQITVQGQMPSIAEIRHEFFDLTPQAYNLEDAANYTVPFAYPVQTSEFMNTMALELEDAIYNPDSAKTGADIAKAIVKKLGF